MLRRSIACALLVVWFGVAPFADEPKVSIKAYPPVSVGMKASVNITMKVLKDPLNRKVKWECDGPNFYRSSTFDVDDKSKVTTQIQVKDIPSGKYKCMITLTRNDDSTVVARTEFEIRGPFYVPDADMFSNPISAENP